MLKSNEKNRKLAVTIIESIKKHEDKEMAKKYDQKHRLAAQRAARSAGFSTRRL